MIENFIHTGIINSKDITSLKQEAKNRDMRIIFLDATFILPTSKENIIDNYNNKHIPEARFFNIKDIADKNSNLPHMIPSKEQFENAVSTLGITNNDIIITYGQHGMIMGPARAWWMFKGFGHINVIVLNGGLPAWLANSNETETGPMPVYEKTSYSAYEFNNAMITDMEELITISGSARTPILDARPSTRFNGSTPEPRDNMRSGHIPSSKNIPCSLLINEYGAFKTADELELLFKNNDVYIKDNAPKKIITTCGSGITACALSLALFHIGYNNVSVYDGSWSEWGLAISPTKVNTLGN